jgi:hypothetical protein
MGGTCSTDCKAEKYKKNISRKPEGKEPSRHRHRWDYNIKVDVEGIRYEGVIWNYLVQAGD